MYSYYASSDNSGNSGNLWQHITYRTQTEVNINFSENPHKTGDQLILPAKQSKNVNNYFFYPICIPPISLQ